MDPAADGMVRTDSDSEKLEHPLTQYMSRGGRAHFKYEKCDKGWRRVVLNFTPSYVLSFGFASGIDP